MSDTSYAPGWPGIPARWTSSSKSGVGTALSSTSRVWFTLSHGILNEIYYPRIDQACTRDLGFIVTDGQDYFSEEKRDADHEIYCPQAEVPFYRLVNTGRDGRYQIEKQVLSDPRRDVVLQHIRFEARSGSTDTYRLFVLLAPHLGNAGAGNTAWVGDYKGVPMLFAEHGNFALALACSTGWKGRSAGFVGTSDGWQDLVQHRRMTWHYERAENGNVALTGEIDLDAGVTFDLALGFGGTAGEAGSRALMSLQDGFETARSTYVGGWREWQQGLLSLNGTEDKDALNPYRASTTVLRVHEAKRFPGGFIASLSIPWGSIKGDGDLGGYHLAWPRDLVEAAGGLLAAGANDAMDRVLHYLHTTQEADGHWPQNMWLDGTPFWQNVQMDEAAFPILLLDLAWRQKAVDQEEVRQLWPMACHAAAFLVQNGPVTGQDRWEEDAGYAPFTLAVEIAALLAAADLAELNGRGDLAAYLRETADCWNDQIERWTYVTDTDLARRLGIEGYYVRVAPPESSDAASPTGGFVPIKNRPPDQSSAPAAQIVSPDALALVRFGLRAPDDPRILNTVKAIDELLKVETPDGPAWHRYSEDGYGEHEDGSPFDGTGIGRAWPLLTGERAHYELAAGHVDEARRLLGAMTAFMNASGLLPEQIWDAPDIPERELFCGRPSNSAMPLVWAHAEYVKLLRSLRDGRVFDTPPQPVQRYLKEQLSSPYAVWRFNHKTRRMPSGKTLRVEVPAPARIHWSSDDWQTVQDDETRETGLGIYVADLSTAGLSSGVVVRFTFYWPEADHWEGRNYQVHVE